MEASSANAPIFGGTQPVPPRRTRVAASALSTVSNRFHAFCAWERRWLSHPEKKLLGNAWTGQTVPDPSGQLILLWL
jgi:hypothetical protein